MEVLKFLFESDLAEFPNIANTLAFERAKIGSDSTILEIDNASEWLIEQRTDGGDRESTGFGLGTI